MKLNTTIDRSLIQTEQEMVDRWGSFDRPLVSISCITYNHEKYIADALDGFLIQKTDFPFEMLVHDDASTDRTPEIIRSYEERYPNIIKPIYQKVNQYSKGVKINPKFNFPRAKGKYIALCEGDDYWIDPNKLKLQVNLMRSYPQCIICFHPAMELDLKNGTEKVICDHHNEDCLEDLKDIILGRGGYMPTASLIFKNENLEKLSYLLKNAPIGDYFLQVYMSFKGGCFYFNKLMSVYRRNALNSWTDSQFNIEKKAEYCLGMLKGINDFYQEFSLIHDSKYLVDVYALYSQWYIMSHNKTIPKIISLFNIFKRAKNIRKLKVFLLVSFKLSKNILKKLNLDLLSSGRNIPRFRSKEQKNELSKHPGSE